MELKKLLIVNDESRMRQRLETFLAGAGYETLAAENSREGLRIFAEQRPKLILTSHQAPEIDGIELLKQIKALDNEAQVIVVTGHGDMNAAVSAIRNGASDFIAEPIRDEIVMLSLERAKEKISVHEQLKDYMNNLEQKVDACTLELKQTQAELIKNERLATIGETVAGLAHCIKNILTGLRGGTYMVNRGLSGEKPQMLREGWSMVQRNIEKMSDLVLDLLRYSKERQPEPAACSPNEIVQDVADLFKERARENGITVNTMLDDNLKEAYTDPNGIHRVLLNLVSNAIDACIFDPDTTKSWEVVLRTRLEKDGGSGDTFLLEVADNGVGMTEEEQAKLFSRFFSTKGGRGTGLGLLVTQKIVHELGGEIQVKTQPGKGTIFSVRLKVKTPAPQSADNPAEA